MIHIHMIMTQQYLNKMKIILALTSLNQVKNFVNHFIINDKMYLIGINLELRTLIHITTHINLKAIKI